jgi:hypothetical protein
MRGSHPKTSSGKRFTNIYRDENRVWDGVRWDGQHPSFFALGETDEKKAQETVRRMEPEQRD